MQEHFSKLEENEKTNYNVEVFSAVSQEPSSTSNLVSVRKVT